MLSPAAAFMAFIPPRASEMAWRIFVFLSASTKGLMSVIFPSLIRSEIWPSIVDTVSPLFLATSVAELLPSSILKVSRRVPPTGRRFLIFLLEALGFVDEGLIKLFLCSLQ